MSVALTWLAFAASAVLVAGYELRLTLIARRHPQGTARSAHMLLRGEWVQALADQPGSEIIAVQTLRNSLMSATITASTAALALMGTVSLAAPAALAEASAAMLRPLSPRLALQLVLLVTLFASYVCSAMAMRYYSHASFVLSLPVGSPERLRRAHMATDYVQRAGLLYSWGLRLFLYLAPVAAGLMNPMFMLPAALALLFALRQFDRAPVQAVLNEPVP